MGQLLREGKAHRRGRTLGRSRRTTTSTSTVARLVSIAAVTTTSLSVFLLLIGTGGDGFVDARFRLGFAPKTRLTWVNGIGYNTMHMELEAPVIAKYFGGKKVEFYHNPTKMVDEKDTRGYFSDLTQAGQQKYLGRITSEVNGLVEHLRAAVRSVGGEKTKNGIVVHIAHSQGALVTCLAAKQLTPLEMSKIEVISFGGATPVRSTPETPFKRCVNYYSVNDPLLFLNPSAESALRSGFNHHIYYSNQNQNNKNNKDEFCFLAPRVGDPIADHMLLGPTYASALKWEGKRFKRKYQSYLRRTFRSTLLASLSIVSAIFQFLVLVWQKLVFALSELRIRLRRALVLSLAAKIRALRSLILAMLARIIAFFLGLNNKHRSTTTTTATPTLMNLEESGSSEPSLSGAALSLASGSASTTSSSKAPAATTDDPMVEQQGSMLMGFRRKPKISPVTLSEKEGVSKTTTAAAVKSRWLAYKNEKQQQ
jgi:hypothetical protein